MSNRTSEGISFRLSLVEKGFKERGYSIAGKDVLSPRGEGMNVTMFLSGVVGVSHYVRRCDSQGVKEPTEPGSNIYLI